MCRMLKYVSSNSILVKSRPWAPFHDLRRMYSSPSRPHFQSRPEPSKPVSEIPSFRTAWQRRFAQLDALFLTGVSRFHEITGYAEIEKMKHELTVLEDKVKSTRIKVREAREQYNERLSKRSNSQSEMNELLMRKQTWLPADLERFTQLYKDDHQIQLSVQEAKRRYDEIESQLEDLQLQSGKLIGARYREEQLWSDRIRQASTWGTWILMGINILLFVIVQLILEPWKRRRLVRAFEAKVKTMLDEQSLASNENTTSSAGKNSDHNATPAADRDLQVAAESNTEELPQNTQSQELNWSTLLDRLFTVDHHHLQPVMPLRPVELGVLALGAGAAIAGLVAGAVSIISR